MDIETLKQRAETLKEKAKGYSVLYVEDESTLRAKATVFLTKIFDKVETAENGEEGFEKYLLAPYDIVLTDILMPKMNGLEMIAKIKQHNERQEVIVLSADTSSNVLSECIQLGVTGYLIKPMDFQQALSVLESSIDKLNTVRENEQYKSDLESMVNERTEKVMHLQDQLIANYDRAIRSLVKMIEGRDTYTGGHSERVAHYARMIAEAMGCSKEESDLIYQAGILHDVGKITTPDAILLKPGSLTEHEYALIKNHVSAGYEILSGVPMYEKLVDIIYAHHEHYDGSGYPRFLKGDEIPFGARIMSIADAFDAMTTGRVYKTKKRVEEALTEIKKLSGIWYDPYIVDTAIKALECITIENDVSQDPSSYIDDERFAYFYKDPLTHLYNHDYLDFLLHKSKENNQYVCLNLIILKNFTAYNHQYGWDKGDQLLTQLSNHLQSIFSDCQIFRIFGDDFALLSSFHLKIDIESVNTLPLLKENNLFCEHKHLDLPHEGINSYKDLQSCSLE